MGLQPLALQQVSFALRQDFSQELLPWQSLMHAAHGSAHLL